MRIYTSCLDAVKEVERDLWELGITVQPHTMQDKVVKGDEDYFTKEMQSYGFMITNPSGNEDFLKYLFPDDFDRMLRWAEQDFQERISPEMINPGFAWKIREETWSEFIHDGRFHYTYNERIRTQLGRIIEELDKNPPTRQAIINIHNNVIDLQNLGGTGRIPCSLNYGFMIRHGKLDCIYTMRSCDFLTHFPFDNWHAIKLQQYIADALGIPVGKYTYFTFSLHAYYKDMKKRGIF